MIALEEIWKEIKGYSMYLVSNYGRVWSKTRIIKTKNGNRLVKGKIRTPQNDGVGYIRYVLVNDEGELINKRGHNLVADAFIPNPKNFPIVNHKDLNKSNNNVLNLEWCDYSQNALHSLKEMKRRTGDYVVFKISMQDARKIRKLKDEGMSNIELASKFNVSRQTIWKIVTFQTHEELQEDE